MKAVVLTELNAPLKVLDVEPNYHRLNGDGDGALSFGQVRVKMNMSGICGSQLLEIGGHKGNAMFVPHLMGHEGAGVVQDVGPGCNRDLLGKKVVCHWRKGDGMTGAHINYACGHVTVGSGPVVTLCEEPIISENRLTPVDADVPDELCALLGCGLSTALGTLEQEAKLRMGETVLIVGCGGVGLNLVKVARMMQASRVVVMDICIDKCRTATQAGADDFIPSRDVGLLNGDFDVIVDTTGSVDALEATIPLLSGKGRYIMIGHPKPGESFRLIGAAHLFHGEGKTIKATQGGGFNPTRDIPRYVAMWRSGRLDIKGIVTHYITLDEINKGIDLVRAGQAGRIMVNIR